MTRATPRTATLQDEVAVQARQVGKGFHQWG